jgi:hypothetical protein
MKSRTAQVTIFIIVAIVIVVAVGGFFLIRGNLSSVRIPASLEPVYTTFLDCLEYETEIGIDVLESQGGYIELPDFESGSKHMPFSSQLNFLGNPVPYWYYVSGNNVQKEQVPTKSFMEAELESFIEERARDCNLGSYYDSGFVVEQREPEVKVDILENKVDVELKMGMSIEKAEEIVIIKNHKISVDSRLGSLYDSAKEIYEMEQDSLFLENYGVDVLYNYAPVTGVELTCAPLSWGADEVFDELENAIEANTQALKVKGGDYSLSKKENEYFVIDTKVDASVRFLNSKDWPHSFEVNPSQGSILISEPVGNQQGLGILGFCYVPYHYVYDVKYPVLVQVSSGQEIFQFPVAVVIQGNRPREALDGSASALDIPEICENANTDFLVNTYDTYLNPVEAEVSSVCLGISCDLGETSMISGLQAKVPQCIGGYLLAKAEGYKDEKYFVSTVDSGTANIVMDKLYEKNVELKIDGSFYSGNAIISFVSENGNSETVVYPEQKTVKLAEGQYEIKVYVYRESSIQLQKTVHEQCVDVPTSGLGGLVGLTKEKCFEVEIPAQVISDVLSGGGSENYYVLVDELKRTGAIEISAGSLPVPRSLEELQENYVLFETKDLGVMFK